MRGVICLLMLLGVVINYAAGAPRHSQQSPPRQSQHSSGHSPHSSGHNPHSSGHSPHRVDTDNIAHWALDEMGHGYQLISVKKVKKRYVDGVLYNLKLKVRAGRFNARMTCKVTVLVFQSDRYLTEHRCFETGNSNGHMRRLQPRNRRL